MKYKKQVYSSEAKPVFRDRTPRQMVLAKQRAAKERKEAKKLRETNQAQCQDESHRPGGMQLTESNVKAVVAQKSSKQYWKRSNRAWEGSFPVTSV